MSRTTNVLARVLIAALFLVSGVGKLAASGAVAGMLAAKGLPAAQPLVFVAAAVEILGALALISGFRLREASLALIGFTIVATALVHQFWAFDGMERINQMNHLLKNLAIIGGLLLVMNAGSQRPGTDGGAKA